MISNVAVLNEGFDEKELDCLIINERKESFCNIA
jgi:superfamily II DNA or RNA helicase